MIINRAKYSLLSNYLVFIMKFLGYVIANEREEYLSSSESSSSFTKASWIVRLDISTFPLLLVLPTVEASYIYISHFDTSHRLWVLELYENLTQFVCSLLESEQYPPPWY